MATHLLLWEPELEPRTRGTHQKTDENLGDGLIRVVFSNMLL